MIRFGARPLIEFIDESYDYLRVVAARHGIEPFMSADGARWNLVLPLPSIDLVLVYRAPVVSSEAVA